MALVSKPVNEDEVLGLPKWAWAAIAGGVITAGLAIYIFAGGDDTKKKKGPKLAKNKKSDGATNKSISSAKSTPSKTNKVKVQDVPEEEQDIDSVSL